MNYYKIFRLLDASIEYISYDGILDINGSYKFNELGCDCYAIAEVQENNLGALVTIAHSYTSEATQSENGTLCLEMDDPCPEPPSGLIIEDDVNLYVAKKATPNEILLNVNSAIVISNGTEEYTLFDYNIPLPDNYVGGYLVYSTTLQMPWAPFFPNLCVNNDAVFNSVGTNINIKLPNLINWRYFQSLPYLSSVFGADATNDWLWYQNNGYTLSQKVTISTPDGDYVDLFPINVRDYGDNSKIDWTWEFRREIDNSIVTAPLSGEVTIVKAIGNMPLNTTKGIDYATVTVESYEGDVRWLISTAYDHFSQPLTPLLPLAGESELTLDNILVVNRSVELGFKFNPNKLQFSENGVRFTARVYEYTNEYTERTQIEFKLPKLPEPKRPKQFNDECCDCKPEIKLASFESEDLIENDITGVAHNNKNDTDTCEFVISKDGTPLVKNGVDYDSGFPYDPYVSAFIFNWKYYLVNYGVGCYKIVKNYTVSGLEFTEEIGVYDLQEFTPDNAEATVRVLYQNNFDSLFNEEEINYTDSGFEDSYRFRGMFGNWQPNVFSESNFSVTNENRVASIKSKDTYTLQHFDATECHINRLHKIVMGASIWRMSDHNRRNTLQESKIYECVLDIENKEQISYNSGSRVTGIEIILSKRQQNSVSLFGGSIQVPKGATWRLPRVTGGTEPTPAEPSIFLQFSNPNDPIIVLGTFENIGVYVSGSGTNYGTITVSTDGVTYSAISYPFTVVLSTTYYFKRTPSLLSGNYKIIT